MIGRVRTTQATTLPRKSHRLNLPTQPDSQPTEGQPTPPEGQQTEVQGDQTEGQPEQTEVEPEVQQTQEGQAPEAEANQQPQSVTQPQRQQDDDERLEREHFRESMAAPGPTRRRSSRCRTGTQGQDWSGWNWGQQRQSDQEASDAHSSWQDHGQWTQPASHSWQQNDDGWAQPASVWDQDDEQWAPAQPESGGDGQGNELGQDQRQQDDPPWPTSGVWNEDPESSNVPGISAINYDPTQAVSHDHAPESFYETLLLGFQI